MNDLRQAAAFSNRFGCGFTGDLCASGPSDFRLANEFDIKATFCVHLTAKGPADASASGRAVGHIHPVEHFRPNILWRTNRHPRDGYQGVATHHPFDQNGFSRL
jgi:hypothetical protein